MPVPDYFVIAPDFCLCEICEKDYPDNKFVHVAVDNEKTGDEHERRWTTICCDCREKCRNDSEYEKFVTEKVFRLKLGRRLKK